MRVIYPDYATGLLGRIRDQEELGRWIIHLEENLVDTSDELLILSLEESDFEVVELH